MPSASPRPVILVHGIKDDSRKMRHLARFLQGESGRNVFACDLLPNRGEVGLEVLAEQLERFVAEKLPAGERFDLVGFSMGGLVSRFYLQRLGGLERVGRFVTIATPHRGTVLAWLLGRPGCCQMRPGSRFLEDLASDADRLSTLSFTSIWSPLDLIILPANSSVIPQATCRKVWSLAHPLMVWEPHCLQVVAQALSQEEAAA